jgi:hypothetical protein
VLVDGSFVGAVTSYKFINITTNHTITANFGLDSITITVPCSAGWNLVSVPVVPATYNASTLFAGAVPGTIYSYFTGSYVSAPTLVNGQGYWAMYAGAGSETLTGTPLTSANQVLATGPRWVLVGSVTTSVPASHLTSTPIGAIVPGTIYGYNGTSYATATTLEPGKGYWIFISAPCTLTISQ